MPTAVIDFLEQDTHTRLVAQPQIRGQEGAELELNLGQEIPVPTTAFTPLAVGGASFNPLTSYQYRPVGVILTMTPRVTYENEIILDLSVENSTVGPPINVAGQSLPTFGTRKVVTRLRLRDGESEPARRPPQPGGAPDPEGVSRTAAAADSCGSSSRPTTSRRMRPTS